MHICCGWTQLKLSLRLSLQNTIEITWRASLIHELNCEHGTKYWLMGLMHLTNEYTSQESMLYSKNFVGTWIHIERQLTKYPFTIPEPSYLSQVNFSMLSFHQFRCSVARTRQTDHLLQFALHFCMGRCHLIGIL